MRVLMLLSNGFAPDPRVAAEALALQEAGHQVTIFAWDRTGKLAEKENYGGVQVVRSHLLTTYSKGPSQIFQFFKFWRGAYQFMEEHPADLIHCHDLDTLQPGIKYGRRKGVPVVYDAHESYPDMVAHLFPKPVVVMVRRLEAFLIPRATAVITVGSILAARFQSLRASRVVIVGNYKKLTGIKPVDITLPPPLKIIYVGGLNCDRLIAPVIEAIRNDSRYQFFIVGDGPERPALTELAREAGNIKFLGFLPQEDARDLIDQCHLVYYGIDATFLNNRFSAPNSLFMALTAGRPVVTTNVGEVRKIVEEHDCGLILDGLSPELIREVFNRYFEPDYWSVQSQKAFQAANNTYNWEIARLNLISLYQDLESEYGKA